MFQQFLRKLIALSLILPFNGILVRGFEARQSKLPDAIPGYALEQIQQAQGTTISVTSPLDDVEDNQNCTLREAIIAANTHSPRDRCVAGSGANTIILPAGVYNIWLSGPNDESSLAGDLDITDNLTITGASAETTTLDGNNLDRILHIHGSSTV
ncbi:MAG TPA: CSLREA domain-containing protein, partial [Anaerolineales bacterium]